MSIRDAYRRLVDDGMSPDANLLETSPVEHYLPFALLSAILLAPVVFTAFWLDIDEALLAKLLLLTVALVVSPMLGLRIARLRLGPNPPLIVLNLVLLLMCIPNFALADFVLFYLPEASRHFKVGHAGLVTAMAALPSVMASIALAIRSRLLRQLRASVADAKNQADEATQARQLAEARLQTLQAQIEPHFLYNTLANVQHLIAHRPHDAEAMLNGLIRYLRESLPKMRDSCSTLGQEFALASAYLDIARIRLGGRLRVETTLADELVAFACPPLVIQTLVENALKHGVEPKVGPVTVRMAAEAVSDGVDVRVEDDGVGLGELQGQGVGLQNIRERLDAIYRGRARLMLQPNSPTGVVATVHIPREAA